MGSSHSKATDIITSVINNSIGLYTNDVQTCNQVSNNALILSQQSSIGGTQTITNINFDTSAVMNQSCMADFQATDDIKDQITRDFNQAADAINSGLNIGANSTDAETITTLMTNLATTVSNSFDQAASEASENVLSATQFTHCDSDQSNAVCDPAMQLISDITFKSYTDLVQSAVDNTTSSSQVADQLDEAISQITEAENQGLNLNFIAALVAAVVVVLALLEYSGVQIINDLTTTIPGMVITLTVMYVVIASIYGFFPFSKKTDDTTPSGTNIRLPCVLNSDCGDGFQCMDQACRLSCSTDTDCVRSDDDVSMVCMSNACVPP